MIETSVVFAAAVLALWVVLALMPARRWPRSFFLAHSATAPSAPSPRVVAIVPARNEAATLPLTLPSLLAQDELEAILVVDDQSTDGTSETAARVARRFSRPGGVNGQPNLEVLAAGQRALGWSGKVHAMSVAVEHCRQLAGGPPEWLLFSDADIEHRSGSLACLLDQADRGRRDLVSIMARLSTDSFWERLLVPPFVYFFHLLYPFRSVAKKQSRVAAAAGGCVLVRFSALDRAGGLERIAHELIDDVALARTLKRSGSAIWLGFDAGIVSVRRYGSGELWNMVARNAFVQLRQSWLLLVLVLLGILAAFVAPPILAIGGLLLLLAGAGPSAAILSACGGLAFALETWSLLPYVRHHRVPGVYAWTLPMASLLYALMTLSSALSHLRGRSARWRGRVYGPETVASSGKR